MGKARILVVEDDTDTAKFIRLQLEAAGYSVVGVVAHADQAIRLANAEKPDLILMDIILSGDMDGIEAANVIYRDLNIPILYLTSRDDESSFERAKVTEAFAYLLKPVNERELSLAIEMALYRHQLDAHLKQSEKHLAEAQRIGHQGSWQMKFSTGQLQWSDEVYRIFGMPVSPEGVEYESFIDLVHPEDRKLVDTALHNACKQGKHYSIYHRIIQADGLTEHTVHHTGEVTLDDTGKPHYITGTLQDVTENKSTEARLWHMAHHDPLCGLPNRSLMYDRLSQAITRSQRNKQQLALLLFDLDGFKLINDNYGHQAGDALLIKISDRLRRCARDSDTVARLAGDEFTILVEQLKAPRDAAIVAQKILDAMQEPISLDGQNFQVTCSIGIALYPDDADTQDNLVKAADKAMYKAKRVGKNTFQFYSDIKRQTH